MAYPMGEAKPAPLRVDFDRRLKLEFHGSKITSDAGLLAYRELDHALGLTGMAGSILTEARHGKNIRHLVEALFRQSGSSGHDFTQCSIVLPSSVLGRNHLGNPG